MQTNILFEPKVFDNLNTVQIQCTGYWLAVSRCAVGVLNYQVVTKCQGPFPYRGTLICDQYASHDNNAAVTITPTHLILKFHKVSFIETPPVLPRNIL